MFSTSTDHAWVILQLQQLLVHSGEQDRLASLGHCPETNGQVLIEAIRQGLVNQWLIADLDDPAFYTTDSSNPQAIGLEASIAATIVNGIPSSYNRLCVGGSPVDAPLGKDVVHVNVLSEDMRFAAAGPRILTNGASLPLPDDFFESSEGRHIPFDGGLTPRLIEELFRTLKPGGVLVYSPSTNVAMVISLMGRAGFTNVAIAGVARQTLYRGRLTLPTFEITADRP